MDYRGPELVLPRRSAVGSTLSEVDQLCLQIYRLVVFHKDY